ncbi:hypothetical protein [Paenibacillus sp. NPDC058177]|uniref:hypothetical protein n=1 Tax=Paenibacillus sp. NPDC058177 TaxID=3346369 RepID=UPI0036DE3ACE
MEWINEVKADISSSSFIREKKVEHFENIAWKYDGKVISQEHVKEIAQFICSLLEEKKQPEK